MNKNEYEQQINLYFELKGTPDSSKESYLRRMNAFIAFAESRDIPLETVTTSDIQQYILYLKRERNLSAGTINNYISAIKFFYTYVLGKEWDKNKIPRMKRRTHLPVIPPRQDVLAIIDATTNIKYKAIFSLLYGSGLRVSEVASLRICDICSKTMSIRVANAKHDTNRYTILSEASLIVLRQYFRATFANCNYEPEDWLFPGRKTGEHLNVKSIKNVLIKMRHRLKLNDHISAHTLRHCFATHCLENKTELALIQQLLGHKNIKTTSNYLHMTSKSMMGVKSPLDTGDGA